MTLLWKVIQLSESSQQWLQQKHWNEAISGIHLLIHRWNAAKLTPATSKVMALLSKTGLKFLAKIQSYHLTQGQRTVGRPWKSRCDNYVNIKSLLLDTICHVCWALAALSTSDTEMLKGLEENARR